jgi:solute:Na+ symporter, SSS family
MQLLDWVVLIGTVFFITLYGVWKSRKKQGLENYFSDKSLPWYTISLSVISTQASAITFLSAPGQAYSDGMRFVLFYLGLPLAMIFVSAVMIPRYYQMNVVTAYQFLESRFDVRVRVLTAFFFLIQRSLAAGISIAAPAIVLSVVLGWDTFYINIFTGGLVLFYTTFGGSAAISQTQKLQMITILLGMGLAGYLVVALMPSDVSFQDAMLIAGKSDKLNTMNFDFKWDDRYNFWSGIIGGFFLQLAYFGTDQSQVGRYLSGSSVAQSRLGLLFNGIFKIPMQFGILFIGAMLFVFYQFNQPPLVFSLTQNELNQIRQSEYADEFAQLEQQQKSSFQKRQEKAKKLITASHQKDASLIASAENEFQLAEKEFKETKSELIKILKKHNPQFISNDTNYIFLNFVMKYLPAGLIGLLIAVIFFAAMSTTASELNALASTTTVDIYKRTIVTHQSEAHYLKMSKWLTIFWGLIAIMIAQVAVELGTLIEVVNILGSWFYGTILGVFLLALFSTSVRASAVFFSAIISQILVIMIDFKFFGLTELLGFPFKGVAYLWLNMIGCLLVMVLSLLLTTLFKLEKKIRK